MCVFEAQLCCHLVLTEPARILELERGERPLEGLYKNVSLSLVAQCTQQQIQNKKEAALSDSALQELEN